MEKITKINVGIDISMDTFSATIGIMDINQDITYLKYSDFENTNIGFNELDKWLKDAKIDFNKFHFTMEATGVYYENLANYLFAQNYLVHVVLPNKAKKYAESLDNKSKTDKLDSKFLGRMGLERKLRCWYPVSEIYKKIKSLTRERSQYVKIRSKFKNRLHALEHSYKPDVKAIERAKSSIYDTNQKIKEIEKELKQIIKSDKILKEKIDLITTIPGVATQTAITVVAEMNGFEKIDNARQLCSYVGLDVQLQESGKWKGKSKISKKGNSYIRGALYFPAMTTVRYSEQHKVFYDRIFETKNLHKKAIVAVGRKLLILIYSLWKNNAKYVENYEEVMKKEKANNTQKKVSSGIA